jgi:hypothetical protein
VAQKREAQYTYKGEKGYMPIVGHIAELNLVIGYEFREGNAAPVAGNLEFVQACERPAFSATLTTTALDRRGLRWFEACP